MSSQGQMANLPGPPYPPTSAGLGGSPTESLDIPISSVIIVLFILAAAWHMTILQLNSKRGHKFVLSGLCFGLCMARIVANIMRIVWATKPQDIQIAIAANVFANAGVVILFIVNLIFAQRILRAYHPRFGWGTPAKVLFRSLYTSIGLTIAMLIVAVVYTFYTLDQDIRSKLRKVQLTAGTFLVVLAFAPVVIVALSLVWPRRAAPLDKFGQGRMRTKLALVLFTSAILTFGASIRAVSMYIVRPRSDPGWWDHKAVYYCCNYGVELVCVYLYGLLRFDRRFHIPDGSHAPGHYRDGVPGSGKKGGKVGSEELSLGPEGTSERALSDEEMGAATRKWERQAAAEIAKNDP